MSNSINLKPAGIEAMEELARKHPIAKTKEN